MSVQAKTIQIFLPGGDPRGIRIADITTRIVQVIEVPRSLLPDFFAMPESQKVALYFLVGEDGSSGEPKAYVGQTGDLRARLVSHNQSKEFWERVLVLISRTDSLTQTHGLFLEWHSLQSLRSAGRYREDNGNGGCRPYTPAPLEADCHEIFETGRTLLATLGHPLFESVGASGPAKRETECFYLRAALTEARGLYTPEGFVVLKASKGRLASVPSIQGTSDDKFRQRLIAGGVMRADGEHVFFDRDHLFNSPSAAAIALTGRTANGWIEWKDKEGRTLHDVKRAPLEGAT